MRVLHLAPMLQSGAGGMIVDLALGLRERGADCEVASSGRTTRLQDWPELVERLRSGGIPYHQINFFDRDEVTFRASVNDLAGLLSRGRFDLIHAHAGVPAAAAHAALEKIGASLPVVTTFYSWGVGRSKWMDDTDLLAFGRSARMIVISSWYRDFLTARGIEPNLIEIIPPGIDSRLFEMEGDRRQLEEACGFEPSESPLLACLAVIERRKNQVAAIEALASLPKELGCRLALIGAIKEPDYRNSLLEASERLGMGGRVALTDKVDDPYPLLAAADLFVFPSLSEGLGIAILEAMALGVPVAASAVEGAADIVIDGRTALAIDPNDPKQIAGALRKLLEEPGLAGKLVRGARKMIEERYTHTRTTERCLELYRRVMDESGGH
jgi:glycosyltransferase involved in cell wall biosynthesis